MLQGCTFRTQMTGMAMEHDEFVADTTNKKTVRNILRAREREHMIFTRFSKINGTFSSTATAGLGVDINGSTEDAAGNFAEDGATNFKPTASVNIQMGSNFDIVVDETDEFQRGISGPISTGTIAYYLSQGWPEEMLTYLLVSRIDVSARLKLSRVGAPEDEDPKTFDPIDAGSYINNLGDQEESQNFQKAIGCRTLDVSYSRGDSESFVIASPSELANIDPSVLASLSEVPNKDEDKGTRGEDPSSDDENDEADGQSSQGFRFTRTSPPSFKLNLSAERIFKPASDSDSSAGDNGALPQNGNEQSVEENDESQEIDGNGEKKYTNSNCVDLRDQVGATLVRNAAKDDGLNLDLTPKAKDEDAPEVEGRQGPRFGELVEQPAASETPPNVGSGQATTDGKGYFDGKFENIFLDSEGNQVAAESSVEGKTEYVVGGDLVMDFRFRSTDGVIYYLGEYIREEPGASYPPKLLDEAGKASFPILRVHTDPGKLEESELLTTVFFNGKTYYVPSTGQTITAERGRTSQVIAFVNQLLNLHRSSDELPSTPVVRVLN